MIKDINGRFNDYAISPKVRQFYCIGAMNQLKMNCYD